MGWVPASRGGSRLPGPPPWRYFLCLVGSTRLYFCPLAGVGGIGSPRVTVTSRRVEVFWYWPDFGAVAPGLSPEVFGAVAIFVNPFG
jgi:hypothetical protein